MKAVILAAGLSTRTYPLTLTRPKPLLPLLDRPLLAYTLEALAPYCDEAVVVIGYRAEMIKEAFGSVYADLSIRYVLQEEPRGTADAVAKAKPFVAGEFVVANGDDYYDAGDVAAVCECAGPAILGARVADASSFGALRTGAEGELTGIAEKSERGAAVVNAGVYKIDDSAFDIIKTLEPSRERGELEFTGAVAAYARRRHVRVLTARGIWCPIRAAADLLAAQMALWPGDKDFVARGVVAMEADATLGPQTAFGEGCEVGAAAVVARSLLFDGVTVGDGARVTDSVLGEAVRVGEQAVVEGAVLGDGVRVGNGAYVAAGARVWPDVRVPAGKKVAGDVR